MVEIEEKARLFRDERSGKFCCVSAVVGNMQFIIAILRSRDRNFFRLSCFVADFPPQIFQISMRLIVELLVRISARRTYVVFHYTQIL